MKYTINAVSGMISLVLLLFTNSVLFSQTTDELREKKAEAAYHYTCGCNFVFYVNKFDAIQDHSDFQPSYKDVDPPHCDWSWGSKRVNDTRLTFRKSPGCDKIYGTYLDCPHSYYLAFSSAQVEQFSCYMAGKVTKLTGYYKATKGSEIRFWAEYATSSLASASLQHKVKYGKPGRWSKFELYFDFTHFQKYEKLTALALYVYSEGHGEKQEIYIDDIQMCAYCDGEVADLPFLEALSVLTYDSSDYPPPSDPDEYDKYKDLDPQVLIHEFHLDKKVNHVMFQFKIAKDYYNKVNQIIWNGDYDNPITIDPTQLQASPPVKVDPYWRVHYSMIVLSDIVNDPCQFVIYEFHTPFDINGTPDYPYLTGLRVKHADDPSTLGKEVIPSVHPTILDYIGYIEPQSTSIGRFMPFVKPGSGWEISYKTGSGYVPIDNGVWSSPINLFVQEENPVYIKVSDDRTQLTTNYILTLSDLAAFLHENNTREENENTLGNLDHLSIELSREVKSQDGEVKVEFTILPNTIDPQAGNAIIDEDFRISSEPLEFLVGNYKKAIPGFQMVNDDKPEGIEKFILSLSGTNKPQIIIYPFKDKETKQDFTIHDNEKFIIGFQKEKYSFWDDDCLRNIVVTISNSCENVAPMEAVYSILAGGTAEEPKHFEFDKNQKRDEGKYSLPFNKHTVKYDGSSQNFINNIKILTKHNDDNVDKSFDIELTVEANSPMEVDQARNRATILISDNESYTVSLTKTDLITTIEPESGERIELFPITLSQPIQNDGDELTVSLKQIDHGQYYDAELNKDYSITCDGQELNQDLKITWSYGQDTTKIISIKVKADAIPEPLEACFLQIDETPCVTDCQVEPGKNMIKLLIEDINKVVYVDWLIPHDAFQDGKTWSTAYKHLQDAIKYCNDSSNGEIDAIVIAEGNYYPDLGFNILPGNRDRSFVLLDGIKLIGGYGGGALEKEYNPSTYETRLSGEIQGDDDQTNNTKTLLYGNVATNIIIYGLILEKGYWEEVGGANNDAIYFLNAPKITIADCIIRDNGGTNNNSKLFNCGTTDNDGVITIVNSRFLNNHSGNNLGNIYLYTPYFDSPNPKIIVKNCLFLKNKMNYYLPGTQSTDSWGGNCCIVSSNVDILNSIFMGNRTAPALTIPFKDIGVENTIIGNCTFFDNEYQAIELNLSGVGSSIIANSIFQQNNGNDIKISTSLQIETSQYLEIRHCNTEQTTDFPCPPGNLINLQHKDPQFDSEFSTPREFDDLRLKSRSPCINFGDNNCVPDHLKTDFTGIHERITNGYIVDLGAFESNY